MSKSTQAIMDILILVFPSLAVVKSVFQLDNVLHDALSSQNINAVKAKFYQTGFVGIFRSYVATATKAERMVG